MILRFTAFVATISDKAVLANMTVIGYGYLCIMCLSLHTTIYLFTTTFHRKRGIYEAVTKGPNFRICPNGLGCLRCWKDSKIWANLRSWIDSKKVPRPRPFRVTEEIDSGRLYFFAKQVRKSIPHHGNQSIDWPLEAKLQREISSGEQTRCGLIA